MFTTEATREALAELMTESDWHEAGLAAGAECLTEAHDYLGRGWAAIPCCPPDHVGVGKNH